MNLLMSVKNVNPKLFDKPNAVIDSFKLLSEIIPPLSARFENGQPDSGDGNNVIDIVAGEFKKGFIKGKVFLLKFLSLNEVFFLLQ